MEDVGAAWIEVDVQELIIELKDGDGGRADKREIIPGEDSSRGTLTDRMID